MVDARPRLSGKGTADFFGYVTGVKIIEQIFERLRDEETAPIVIKMYELSASGRGPAAIANYLRAEKIPIPAYWHHVRGERAWQGYR